MAKPEHRRARNREHDTRRRTEQPWRAWYSTARWQALREQQLDREPRCERCKANGLVVAAKVAHHKDRHRGDPQKFWCGELASSCAPCHDTIERSIEAIGFEFGNDSKGRPIASDHPWNKTRGTPRG